MLIMKKVKKILLGAVVGILVLLVVAVIAAGLFLGNIVKAGINTVGPKLTQTSLTVETVDVSLLTGSATVKNLIVGNPQGYRTTNAISVGVAAVSVVPTSVLSDKIVVKSIRVEAPEITFEGNPLGENNLKKIEDNVNAATAGGQTSATAPTAKGGPAKPAKKLEVDDFLITGAKVHFGAGATLPLPDIHLMNLGTGPNGITPADLTKQVLSEVVSGTIKAVAKSATNVGKGAENVGKEGANAVKKGLGGLFKKATN
jgi:uncharacterized protein involved in outer membrane biogenesis